MIKFNNVFIKHLTNFYSLYNCNLNFNCNTLLIENDTYSALSIMRILSKIDRHYSGEVFIDNINLKNIKDKDLNVAYIPKNPVLFKNTFKNLNYVLKIRKINKNERINIINSTLCKYNLQNLNKKIKNLNLSEQKILCLIRAIIRKPKYILLENFFENLDSKYLNLAQQILKDAEQFLTIIACEKDDEKTKFLKYTTINLN